MAKKRASSSIPAAYRDLFKRGERYRFHGGWLGESEMDRTIAEWLDGLPERDTWPIVKTILYAWITGRSVGHLSAPQIQNAGEFNQVENAILQIDD